MKDEIILASQTNQISQVSLNLKAYLNLCTLRAQTIQSTKIQQKYLLITEIEIPPADQ